MRCQVVDCIKFAMLGSSLRLEDIESGSTPGVHIVARHGVVLDKGEINASN